MKTVQDCGLFPRPSMRGVDQNDALHDFRLFGFCLGIALRDRRMFPVPLSVAFADALCGKRITLWDVMIGQFLADTSSWGVPIMEYLDSGSRFGVDYENQMPVKDDECGKLHDIPDLSLLAPEDIYPALPSLPLHALCPSSISFIATRMSTTMTGCLLHLSQPDMASFPFDEEQEFTLVAISGAKLPEGCKQVYLTLLQLIVAQHAHAHFECSLVVWPFANTLLTSDRHTPSYSLQSRKAS
jgi:hypothetical protein